MASRSHSVGAAPLAACHLSATPFMTARSSFLSWWLSLHSTELGLAWASADVIVTSRRPNTSTIAADVAAESVSMRTPSMSTRTAWVELANLLHCFGMLLSFETKIIILYYYVCYLYFLLTKAMNSTQGLSKVHSSTSFFSFKFFRFFA